MIYGHKGWPAVFQSLSLINEDFLKFREWSFGVLSKIAKEHSFSGVFFWEFFYLSFHFLE